MASFLGLAQRMLRPSIMHHDSPILGRHILLVDDNNMLRWLIRLELEAAGYHVTEAGDGLKALQCLEETAVSLVISDNRMPRLDGLGLLAAIRRYGNSIPVILVSAGLQPEQEAVARASGVSAVFRKPVEWDSLLQTVHQLCDNLHVATVS
jgi:CheY-like chemotaxis protein